MTKYTILTAIGLAICIIVNGINYFATPLSDTVVCVATVIGAVFLIAGLYFRRKEKK